MSKIATASPAWAYPYVLKLVNTTNSISAKNSRSERRSGEKVAPKEAGSGKSSKRG